MLITTKKMQFIFAELYTDYYIRAHIKVSKGVPIFPQIKNHNSLNLSTYINI